MSLVDLHNAFDLIEKYDGSFIGERSVDLIAKAEEALGCEFPPTYKEFVSIYGCGDIEGLEFYGLTDSNFDNSGVPNAVWLTLDERKSNFPDNLVLIYSIGDGNYAALKVDEISEGQENPVVLISPVGEILEVIASDFGSFMLEELESVI